VLQPLEEEDRRLYPELEAYFGTLPKLGRAVVLRAAENAQAVAYTMNYAASCVRKARMVAGLPDQSRLMRAAMAA
jgi:hypothetical protein